MRLASFRDAQGVHLGAVRVAGAGHEILALDAVAPDMLTLIDRGPEGLAAAAAAAETAAAGAWRSANSVTLLAPIPRPRQNVMCVGLNYVAHAIESDRARGREPKLPSVPVFFTKAVTAVANPWGDFVLDPAVTQELDYEVELAFIVGRTGKNIPRAEALSYVFGYTVANDISARDLQSRHQQFFKGKSLDGSCPLGPWIVTADEIPDPAALTVRLRVNGEPRQESSVSDLIFDVPTLIEYLSLGMTLEAGTIVCTGTPSGVGLGFTPPKYLNAGDVVEAEIEGIGGVRTRVVG
jgi:2-keto-4-pentenoate hydratase/2-oxohepta-3-ene-1,7-dioic acid hydratase in catechol pathway